ncbi:MAG: hypothetical protein ACK47M_09035 [Caldilinea sp.]
MKAQRVSWSILLVMCILALSTVLIASASSESTGFALTEWTTAPSGILQGGSFMLQGSSGQADAGAMSGGDFALSGGFWQPVESTYSVHLPMIEK